MRLAFITVITVNMQESDAVTVSVHVSMPLTVHDLTQLSFAPQLPLTVWMVMCSSREVAPSTAGVRWCCATTESGGRCVMTCGMPEMPLWCADN